MNCASINRRVNVADDEVHYLANATVRGGWAETRPAIRIVETAWDADTQAIFENGRMQGSCFYSSTTGDFVVYAVDGELFTLDIATHRLRKIELNARPFSAESPFVWFCTRSRYLIAQDGISPPVIINGATAAQGTNPTREVPTGKMMADGWGRLAVVAPNRRWIYFSNHESDPQAESKLAFTEDTNYYANTRYFEVSSSLGRIVGMTFAPSLNGGNELGPLAVFCEHGVVAYDISVPRENWSTSDITTTIFNTIGACAHGAITARGNDILFSDQNGRIQTLRNAISRQEDAAVTIMDAKVWPIYEKEESSLRSHRMSVRFGERMLTAVLPERHLVNRGRYVVRHRAIIALQETPAIQRNPVWDGVWTGVQPTAMTVAGERCFIVSLDDDGIQRIYSLSNETGDDRGHLGASPIPMIVGLSGSDHGTPFLPKPHKSAVMRLGGINGAVAVKGYWQRDRGAPQPWFNAIEASIARPRGSENAIEFPYPQARARLNLPSPADKPAVYYEAAPWFEITGSARLEEVTIEAKDPKPDPDSVDISCNKPESAPTYGCEPSPFTYRIHAPAS